jgi:salicylate hydroxylase
MTLRLAIAGAGPGGLAAAIACRRRAACEVQVLEQARAFSEVGAGIQLGPNVTRLFDDWGLTAALRRVAAQPRVLIVRDAVRGGELARMELGDAFARRYGAPYLTLHRADLQQLLLESARDAGVTLRLDARVSKAEIDGDGVSLQLEGQMSAEADALVASDGVWSALRSLVIDDGPARPSGHFAYRAVAQQARLPAALRSEDVRLWLGPRTHVVCYPVRRGELLNVVAIVEAPHLAPSQDWEQGGVGAELSRAMGGVAGELRRIVQAMPTWGVWGLHTRPPVAGPNAMARGRVALLGDAAHPMLPYLAQGAGMAIEDADALARALADVSSRGVQAALMHYAQERWRRCAQVQSRAQRNSALFHASGPLQWARDAALRAMGEKLLDQPWLYSR